MKLHYHAQNKKHQKIAPATALLWIAPTRIPEEDHQEERQHRVDADKRPSEIFARMCDQIIRDCCQDRYAQPQWQGHASHRPSKWLAKKCKRQQREKQEAFSLHF